MMLVNIRMALAALRSAKVRTMLTMVAVIIGVTAFTVVTTVADGFKVSIENEINAFGGNLVQITPGESVVRDDEGNIVSFNPVAAFGTSTISEKDVKDIKNTPGIASAAPLMLISGVVSRGETEAPAGSMIIATNEDYPIAFNQELAQGGFFKDSNGAQKQIVIGHGIAEALFGENNPLGGKLQIRGQDFVVVGVLAEVESALGFAGDFNTMSFISSAQGKQFNNGVIQIMEVDAQLEDGADPDQVVQAITETLKENHGGEEDFTVIKQDEVLELTDSIIGLAESIANTFAYIMLLVGTLVIMLIMLVSVSERTREIGIRKSIGAANSHILSQFLVEAVVISWLGSSLGIVLAYLLGLYIKYLIDVTPVYTVSTLIATIILATIVGALAGLAPAFKAARKDPVEALRHE